ncbi:PQQ-binding-like beta-propeller repeat protein [Streptomyces sp. NPDC045431]|uniref:outer membrane protein assembly factor BamB family protein n=1 Tax=Streptomyces sp. NPDC045431 TaxID=3155613 RepID=UPI0033F05A4F
MTQPPPPPPNHPPGSPPGQPPQGGFGAPTPPPNPGYGYPQAPGQAPGYGYPQAPGQPPGYGYPQAPGQAPGQVPGQQPYGYGYPTAPVHQQPPGQPPLPPPGGRKPSTQLRIIIAAAVAVALIIAGGIWYAGTSGDDGGKGDEAKGATAGATAGGGGGGGGGTAPDGPGKEKAPANTRSKVAFQMPHPKVADVTTVAGSWITDKAYVKSGIDSVVGYDLDKGTPLWTLPLPGQVCAASRHVQDNKTAIAFEATKRVAPKYYQPCTEVGVIDLTTGKLLWSKSAAGTGNGPKIRFSEVTVGAGAVAAGGTDGGGAWDLATGKELWKPQINAEQCYDMGYGGGAALVAARKCGPRDQQYVLIQNLDPKTGRPLAQFKMPDGVEYASVVSTKPLVVAADVGDTAGDGSGISDLFSLDEKTGKLKAKIAVDAERFAGDCDSTLVEACSKVVVGNGRVYLPTEDHEGAGEGYGQTNEIVSFDLTTGKPTSDKAEAGDRYSMFPLRMDGGNIIAYKEPPYDKGGQIVSIDGSTFKQTVLLENPADEAVRDAESSFSLDHAEIRYTAGRLFISERMISEPSSSSVDDKQYFVLAYTTH